MRLETKTVVNIELNDTEALALMVVLNGFRDLEINDKDFFNDHSISEKEELAIDEISKQLNSISTLINQ